MADQHPEIPLEQATAAAEALEACRVEVVEGMTRAIYEHGGAALEAFGERGRAHCREDLHQHLDYHAGSLVAGSPDLFGSYGVWMESVPAAHGVPGDSLPRSLELLRDFLARLRPQELRAVEAVLAPRTDGSGAAVLVERLRRAVADMEVPNGLPAISASVGVAERRAGESTEGLIGRADEALYEAKAAGRNRVAMAHAAE